MIRISQFRTLVSAAASQSSIKSIVGIDLKLFWRFSLDTACVARSIATAVRVNHQAAYSCGLIHGLGMLAMHVAIPDTMEAFSNKYPSFHLNRAIAKRRHLRLNYAQVSAAFARTWNFPKIMVDGLAQHVNPFDGD